MSRHTKGTRSGRKAGFLKTTGRGYTYAGRSEPDQNCEFASRWMAETAKMIDRGYRRFIQRRQLVPATEHDFVFSPNAK